MIVRLKRIKKKYLIMIVLGGLLCGCSKQHTDLPMFHVKGNVRCIIEKLHSHSVQNGQVFYRFAKNGLLVSRTTLIHGEVVDSIAFTRAGDSLIGAYYGNDFSYESLINRFVHFSDYSSFTLLSNQSLMAKMVFQSNNDTAVTGKVKLGKNVYSKFWRSEFAQENVSQFSYFLDESLKSRAYSLQYEYNENGDYERIRYYSGKRLLPSITYEYDYRYDQEGNWIEQEIRSKQQPTLVVKRDIIYYD